ncbi:hypothetical protein BX600DRAFT_506424 [Xylariales sp. PMI_506]|nr:hypothetical protein BX600DRAFT_506424 [Xylariales sp. PMI_506]
MASSINPGDIRAFLADHEQNAASRQLEAAPMIPQRRYNVRPERSRPMQSFVHASNRRRDSSSSASSYSLSRSSTLDSDASVFTSSTSPSSAPSTHSSQIILPHPINRSLPSTRVSSSADMIFAAGASVNLSQETLPCEFRGYMGCNTIFQLDETEDWIEHIVRHFRDKLPQKSICWICDDMTFDAKDRRVDLYTNFRDRLIHIQEHFRFAPYWEADIKPDFFVLKHLHLHQLIPEHIYHRARAFAAGRHAVDGIVPHNFMPLERLRELEHQERIPHDQRKEDRMRKKSGRRFH